MPRFLAVVALIACGCRPSAELTTAPDGHPAAASVRPAGETPTHLLLPGGSLLYTAADDAAPALHLAVPEDLDSPARAVAVVGRDGEYWEIETIDGAGLEGIAAEPLDGLSYYRLRLWVPLGTGTEIWPIPPGPDAPTAREQAIADARASGILGALQQTYNPPLQAGGFRPADRTTDFRIAAGATVFWPDGREAGEVRHEHAFLEPGVARDELLCFAIAGATSESRLCFASASVREVEFVPEGETAFGVLDSSDENVWGGLVGEEVEEYGGIGLVGSGYGGGGSVEGIGTIGHGGSGGGGGTGSGFGTGGGGELGRQPVVNVTMSKPTVTGDMDPEIGRRLVRAHLNQIRYCWTKSDPADESGQVELKLEVDDAGSVTAQHATASDARVTACVEKVAKDWTFPQSLAGSFATTFTFATTD